MSMLAETYLNNLMALLDQIKTEEMSNISKAANLMASAIVRGKNIFAFGCTHSSLPIQDLIYRAGGLMIINPIFGPGISSLDIRPVTITSAIEKLQDYAEVLLDHSPISSGDVLIIVSVSGRNAVPVEMAQQAKKREIKVIGVTSIQYASAVPSRHPSGKKMHDFSDIVLDNKVDKGDALLEASGVPQKFCPGSGVTSTALLHAVVSATVEELLAQDITPPIFLSGNIDGGPEYNAKLLERYKENIFYM